MEPVQFFILSTLILITPHVDRVTANLSGIFCLVVAVVFFLVDFFLLKS